MSLVDTLRAWYYHALTLRGSYQAHNGPYQAHNGPYQAHNGPYQADRGKNKVAPGS
jgi:hypothetical protein